MMLVFYKPNTDEQCWSCVFQKLPLKIHHVLHNDVLRLSQSHQVDLDHMRHAVAWSSQSDSDHYTKKTIIYQKNQSWPKTNISTWSSEQNVLVCSMYVFFCCPNMLLRCWLMFFLQEAVPNIFSKDLVLQNISTPPAKRNILKYWSNERTSNQHMKEMFG